VPVHEFPEISLDGHALRLGPATPHSRGPFATWPKESSNATPVGVLQVQNLVGTASDFDGALDIGWDAVRGAGTYELQTSADPVTTTN
jgi:hypothetical protein